MSEPKKTKECPHCYSEIDARATVCPQCRRDIAERRYPEELPPPALADVKIEDGEEVDLRQEHQERRRQSGNRQALLVIALFVIVLLIMMAMFDNGDSSSSRGSSRENCAVLAAEHKEVAEDLMVEYLAAHRSGNATMKAGIRDLVPQIDFPSCAWSAGSAMRDWMNAVDRDDQAGMTAADNRFLDAFE